MKTELAAQTFVPIGNLVIIQPIEVEKTKAGIIFPEYVRGRTDQSRPTEDAAMGLAISAGALCKFVRRGDLVILNGKMPGFVHEGVKVAIGTEMQVVGIVRDADGKVPEFKCCDWETQEVERTEPQPEEEYPDCLRCGSSAHKTSECKWPPDVAAAKKAALMAMISTP